MGFLPCGITEKRKINQYNVIKKENICSQKKEKELFLMKKAQN